MTTTTTATTSPTTSAAAPRSAASAGVTTSAAEQQDRFMSLLVAQMRNQDPLNPMDNAQMTSQIAQINTVAGLEKLNKTVEGLFAGLGALQSQSAIALPGRSVLVAGDRLTLGEGPAQAGIAVEQRAEAASAEVLGADGRVLRSLTLGPLAPGVRAFIWDGLQADGSRAPPGEYRLRVTAQAAGQALAAAPLIAARVQSVAPSAAGMQVDLGSAGVRAWDDLKAFL